MTVLHVACLPFPTYQGTQAALASILHTSSELGRPVHLLTYARGAHELDTPYPIDRIPDFPRVRSLRSGPSVGKLALDARCGVETRRLCEQLKPDAIVAHHIEAALAVLAARVGPIYYVAHTSLEHELPIYFPPLFDTPIASIGRYFEVQVCRQATGAAAVAPSLARMLGKRTAYLPVPWARSAGNAPALHEARQTLGLPVEGPICLYAGNLDRYQGWEDLIPALVTLRKAHPGAQLLIATESDPAPARLRATRIGLRNVVHFRRLAGESARRLTHAAADLTWVPRRTNGGLPIKMLDAFARMLPVIAMKRATAALAIDEACLCVPNDDPRALAEAADRLLADRVLADRLRSDALTYLSRHHSAARFDAAMQRFLNEPPRPSRVRDARHRSLST